MTAFDRFERDLPSELEGLAGPHTPDYLTDILSRTATTSQRPAWTFPERWLPMAEITSRSAIAPRVPWRMIAVALVLISLLVAGAVYVGSRQTRLPPPFGPAKNGLVAYSKSGDIYAADPVTGVAKAIVIGPERDTGPSFSPDGRFVAFDRGTGDEGWYNLVVADVDGSNVRILTTKPYWKQSTIVWAPDSSALYRANDAGQFLRIDALHVGPSQVIAEGLVPDLIALQPPDGAQILYKPKGADHDGLWIMNADGTDGRSLLKRPWTSTSQWDFGEYYWSPNGKMIAFMLSPEGKPDEARIYVMDADGTHVRPLSNAPGSWFEAQMKWSPDSTHIAFNRWGDSIYSIGIASVDGGPVLEANVPTKDGELFDYAPDGLTIWALPYNVGDDPTFDQTKALAIDVTDGSFREMAWPTGMVPTWQRRAP